MKDLLAAEVFSSFCGGFEFCEDTFGGVYGVWFACEFDYFVARGDVDADGLSDDLEVSIARAEHGDAFGAERYVDCCFQEVVAPEGFGLCFGGFGSR